MPSKCIKLTLYWTAHVQTAHTGTQPSESPGTNSRLATHPKNKFLWRGKYHRVSVKIMFIHVLRLSISWKFINYIKVLCRESVIFAMSLNFLIKPLFWGWPTGYKGIPRRLVDKIPVDWTSLSTFRCGALHKIHSLKYSIYIDSETYKRQDVSGWHVATTCQQTQYSCPAAYSIK